MVNGLGPAARARALPGRFAVPTTLPALKAAVPRCGERRRATKRTGSEQTQTTAGERAKTREKVVPEKGCGRRLRAHARAWREQWPNGTDARLVSKISAVM